MNAFAFSRSASVESALIAFSTRASKAPRSAASAPSRLGERALRLARLERGPIAVGERPAQGDDVDAGGAGDEPDQECDDGHEGDTR